jgi:hypothetical protein
MVLALLLAVASLAAPTTPVVDLTSSFAFRPERVPVGEVFHFRKSTLDGTRPVLVSVHVASPDRLEVLKVEDVGRHLARVSARMDWKSFSAVEIRSWNRLETGEPTPQAEFRLDPATGRVEVQLGGARDGVAASALPVHLYNFDFLSLAFAWLHLVRLDAPVRVGVVDPNFARDANGGGLLVDKGIATFTPEAEEPRGGVPCRRYAVAGPAFQGRSGTLWADARTGQWVEFRHPVPDNPDWKSFRLELVGWERMAGEGWGAFVAGRVRRAADLLRDFGEE